MELAGLFLVFLGVFTKCAALLATIPEALVGGMLCMGVAMIAGVSISNLQLVDLSKSRNLSIIGLSLMIGLIVPRHVDKSPISFGINGQLDDIANMLLSIKMLVGGMVAVFLDNTVPGESRRLLVDTNVIYTRHDLNLNLEVFRRFYCITKIYYILGTLVCQK